MTTSGMKKALFMGVLPKLSSTERCLGCKREDGQAQRPGESVLVSLDHARILLISLKLGDAFIEDAVQAEITGGGAHVGAVSLNRKLSENIFVKRRFDYIALAVFDEPAAGIIRDEFALRGAYAHGVDADVLLLQIADEG